MASGIYRIINRLNEKSYIGSSQNISRRWYLHRAALRRNRHHSVYLQRAWNKYGEAAFEFELIRLADPSQLLIEEEKAIVEFQPEYNVGGVSGGDLISRHPHREAICQKISLAIKKRYASMSADERDKLALRKSRNPNWRGGRTFCKCGARKPGSAASCQKCRDMTSSGNPFYGKTHSAESKRKMSEALKGKRPANARRVVIDSVSYSTQSEAARLLGVSEGTISRWVKRQSVP